VVNVFPSLSRNDAPCVLADVIKYFFNLIFINYIIYENLSATQKIISTLIGVYIITEKIFLHLLERIIIYIVNIARPYFSSIL
jgi:hypothetical protein